MPLMFALALAAVAAPAAEQPSADAEKLIQDCSAHHFETTINVTMGGKPRQSKVKMCGVPGQSDAQWIGTLRDAIAKVETNPKLPPAVKVQITSAVQAEIERLGGNLAPPKSPALVNAPALPPTRQLPSSAAPQYSALPPFPPAPSAPTLALGTPGPAAPGAPTLYVAPLPRPRLSFTCFSPGDVGTDGPCFAIDRDTIITVRAGEPLKDTVLRFVRDGAERADVALPPLARGRSTRLMLPREVCAHVVGGSLTIRIVRGPPGKPEAAQVVGTEGPFNLRC